MGKWVFITRENLKSLKSHFWPGKFTNIGLEYTKRCGIAAFGGVSFPRKVDFVYIYETRRGRPR